MTQSSLLAPTLLPQEARAIAARVQAHLDAGALDKGVALAQEQLSEAVGEARAILQHALALACNVLGRSVDALRAAAAARDGFKAIGSREGELDALLAIGSVMRSAGDHASAMLAFEEAEPMARTLCDEMRLGVVLCQIGVCCSLLGRHQQALSSLHEAALIHSRGPNDREHLSTLLSLYNAHNRRATSLPKDSRERIDSLEEHLERWRTLAEDAARGEQTRMELMALGNYAITLHDCGRHRNALAALAALLPRYRAHGMAPNEAICFFEMGRAHESLGEHDAAREHYGEAIAMFDRTGSSGHLREALEGLSNVEERRGDHRAALAALRRARAIEAETNDSAAHRSVAQRELRLELARLSSQWQRLASTDPLTGLANRRALENWMSEVRPRVELGEPLIVLLHDMDHFKSINDRFGHGVGDDVLRQVAILINANCRPHDLAVRYGGEEFLLALVGVDYEAAIEVAERLRVSVQAFEWSTIASELCVTVSIGIADVAEARDTMALLTLADRRLYAAKHGGRNRVVHSG